MNETGTVEEHVTMDKLMRDFKVVVQDAEGLLKASAGDLGEKAREARDRLNESLVAAKASFHRVEERALDRAKEADKVIREHPYESIGIAFGGGLLIGLLLAR